MTPPVLYGRVWVAGLAMLVGVAGFGVGDLLVSSSSSPSPAPSSSLEPTTRPEPPAVVAEQPTPAAPPNPAPVDPAPRSGGDSLTLTTTCTNGHCTVCRNDQCRDTPAAGGSTRRDSRTLTRSTVCTNGRCVTR